MKNLIVFLTTALLLPVAAKAQLLAQPKTGPLVIVSFGAHQSIMDNTNFDLWTINNYGRVINSAIGFSADILVAFKHTDAGFYITSNSPWQNVGVFYGLKLTRPKARFSSFLNLEVGNLNASFRDIAPVNYTPTTDQQGQDLELHHEAYFVGLSTRNYFNAMRFRIGKKKDRFSLNPGFFVAARYVFTSAWKYGYNQDNGDDDTTFESVRIHSIPNTGKFMIDAGIFIGIGG